MYFTDIKIENTGPLGDFNLTPELTDNGNPKPIVIAGENGSGKSILLSHLINFLMTAKQQQYEDSEIEQGKVYKYRSPNYIQTGKHFSYSKVKIQELEVSECQLPFKKSKFQEALGYEPDFDLWQQMPNEENSFFHSNLIEHTALIEKLIDENCILYFPVNRFEEPAWLNVQNLKEAAKFTDLRRINGYSNRKIINISPLKDINGWLLDLFLDREIYEKQISNYNGNLNGIHQNFSVLNGYQGTASKIVEEVLKVLKIILRKPAESTTRLGINDRQNRQISIMENNDTIIPNIFQMSTGETQLLNLFLSIIKDYDLCHKTLTSIDEITGIVIVDEIDAHLHSIYQFEVLPLLIKAFPKVQFIMTSHSPLLTAGLKNTLGENGFTLIDMPTGSKISTDDFNEFEQALNGLKDSRHFIKEIEIAINAANMPIIYAEGDYDVRYIRKACELFNRNNLLEGITLKDADGEKNLKNIWNQRKLKVFEDMQNRTMLLFDGEINVEEADYDKLLKRKISFLDDNPIKAGIENLFPSETINRLKDENPRFINHTPAYDKVTNGETITVNEIYELNKDQKRNICDSLCNNGTTADFNNFIPLLDMIEESLLTELEGA